MDKLREEIMLVLNWLWLRDEDKKEICNEIYDDVKNNSYLNMCLSENGIYYIDDVQEVVCDVLKRKILQ